MMLGFVLFACMSSPAGVMPDLKDDCFPIAYFETSEQCANKKKYMEDWWREQVGDELPYPVHCEDLRT
jgi:hypothetical protein